MRRLIAAVSVLALLVAGCSGSQQRSDSSDEIVVFAAASLTGAFTRIGNAVEDENPGVQVRFSFGGSPSLVTQIRSGAPADVFASANSDTMQLLINGGDITGEPRLFARNELRVAVPEGNPAGVEDLQDLGDPDLTLALCSPEVPCGAAAQRALQVAGVSANPATFEEDVKAVIAKVQLGEVDAGLVYETDVLAAGDQVEGIEFEESDQALNDYAIAEVAGASNSEGAQAFIRFVSSLRGREILRDAGFDVP